MNNYKQKSQTTYAPILITVLDRFEHFKRCVESLAKCEEAKSSHLYIALDYPPNEKYKEGYKKVKSYIEAGNPGFHQVTVIERTENYGVWKNYIYSMGYVLKKYESIIVTEDDNEFSVDFLNYMNAGLEAYKNNEKVLSICGYNYPFILELHDQDVFAYDGFSAWGFGTWRSKFQRISWDIEELRYLLEDDNNKKMIGKNKALIRTLNRIVQQNSMLGDAYISFYQIKNDMLSIFPVISRVRNHGHDGTGVHCGKDESAKKIYSYQNIYEGSKTKLHFPQHIQIDVKVKEYLDKSMNPNRLLHYVKNPISLFLRLRKILKGK